MHCFLFASAVRSHFVFYCFPLINLLFLSISWYSGYEVFGLIRYTSLSPKLALPTFYNNNNINNNNMPVALLFIGVTAGRYMHVLDSTVLLGRVSAAAGESLFSQMLRYCSADIIIIIIIIIFKKGRQGKAERE